ncbi:MAG: cupin domain-containing protein [Acidimicrobiia bacterium]|nr:cupin domain-containing protein [Acidimicrobiia bacterium]
MSAQNPPMENKPEVFTAGEIDSIPAQPLGNLPGIENRLLFSDGKQMAGILTIAKGHTLGAHTHRDKQHHLLILDGEVDVLGKRVGNGAYVHIPPGFEHNIDATDTEGCSIFYLYQAMPSG